MGAKKAVRHYPLFKSYVRTDETITTSSRGERTACIGVPQRHKKCPNAAHQANSLALTL